MRKNLNPSPIGFVIKDIILREMSARDMNIHRFAALIEIPRSSVYNILEGQAPTLNALDNLIEKLGLSWADVGKEIETERKQYYDLDPGDCKTRNNGSDGNSSDGDL